MRILLYGASGMLGEAIIDAVNKAGHEGFKGAYVPPERFLTGSRARKLRTLAAMPLQALANASGVNKAYLSEFENDIRTLHEPELWAVARALAAEQPAGRFMHDAVSDDALVRRDINQFEPDVIINAAGIIPERRVNDVGMVYMNAVLPHVIAERAAEAGVPMIHVSTDCVNELTCYGTSKLAGEPTMALTIRTSFVGPRHGLWKWYTDANDRDVESVDGWQNVKWSGSTVWAVADALVALAYRADVVAQTERTIDGRMMQLATEQPISKYRLLQQLRAACSMGTQIRHVNGPMGVARVMAPDIELPSFADALAERHE